MEDLKTLIDRYSMERYDFKPDLLSKDEIDEVKTLAKEKRYDYGNAPIGTNIFKLIRDKEREVYFEKDDFNSNFDAMIYVPDRRSNLAFIILNKSKPLVNQIFATAHEYYHYLEDIEAIKNEPIICSLSESRDKREQKASRFAAEFLLPDEALRNEIKSYSQIVNCEFSKMHIDDIAIFCYWVSINYAIPPKAVIYRLVEEKYLKEYRKLVNGYDFIKKSLQEVFRRRTSMGQELFSSENRYIDETMYDLVPKAYNKGYVSYDKLLKDLELLSVCIEHINIDIPKAEENETEDDDDVELLSRMENSIVFRG